ncbi:amidoligase family protein [uncultured Sphaerochaeta sp.]|uniref:amidoligase family protein n=1 Tax=uncultured Sphaerochaeta sp. TaxID=886478 RepID=UPI002A0A3262|nr:amidoligase family protein [uncultured Sphaerochaeta sp.]
MDTTTRFGIEVEMTGITRKDAAQAARMVLGGELVYEGSYYDTWKLMASDGREWKFTYDGSIRCETRSHGARESATRLYGVEMVSPILTYEADIERMQEVIRAIRKAGAFANNSCGIHIHLDGQGHTPRSIRNFVNIIYARNDLFYKALGIEARRARYCKKMDEHLVSTMNRRKPTTFDAIEDIWYAGYRGSRQMHYHESRYHFLNLHSFFHGHRTVELRGFNSTLHAGEVRSYIAFALALNNQALKQTSASTKKPQVENEKFAMRTYLNRIGFIGDEFKSCREHLTKRLAGSGAWRFRPAA